jgi:hypothetical protein
MIAPWIQNSASFVSKMKPAQGEGYNVKATLREDNDPIYLGPQSEELGNLWIP